MARDRDLFRLYCIRGRCGANDIASIPIDTVLHHQPLAKHGQPRPTAAACPDADAHPLDDACIAAPGEAGVVFKTLSV